MEQSKIDPGEIAETASHRARNPKSNFNLDEIILPAEDRRKIDGAKLAAARQAVCPKQLAFAVQCGLSAARLCQLESAGTHCVPAETAEKIAKAFKKFEVQK